MNVKDIKKALQQVDKAVPNADFKKRLKQTKRVAKLWKKKK